MPYKKIQDVPLLKGRYIVFSVGALLLSFTSCKKNMDEEYFVSYQEIEKEIGPVNKIFESKNSDSIIELYNDKNDTVAVLILTSKIKTVRENEKNRNRYTSFTSLDSVIQVLKRNSFDSLHARRERNEPKIFFIDERKDNLIKIIPARQVYQISKDNYNRFH